MSGRKANQLVNIPTAEQIRKDNVLQALLTASNINAAADAAGVSRKTVYTYLNTDGAFLLAYRDAKREQLRAICDRMSEGATKATDYIIKLIGDEDAPPAVRLQASVKLLELYTRFREIEGKLNMVVFKETNYGENSLSDIDSFFGITYPNSL